MALDIKIERKKLNYREDKKEIFVATADRNGVIDTDKMANEIAKDTGARPAQVKMILNALSDSMMTWLEEGHGVRFGKLGSFLPSVRSKSSENADEAGVKKVRVSFRPSRELSKKVAAISINTVDDGDEDEPDASQDGGSTEGGSGGEGQDFV